MEPIMGRKLNKILISITIVLIVALLAVFHYFYQSNPKDEAARLISKLSSIYDVPTDETPTILDLNEPEKLRNQPFFAKAQKGDKLFIYLKNQKAILYDPVTNKIVNVDVASVTQQSNSGKASFPTNSK